VRRRYKLQKHAPSDLLPPAQLHLLKFPPSLKIAPPAGDQAWKTKHDPIEDISYSSPNRRAIQSIFVCIKFFYFAMDLL
jgi:hypothetical protein